MVQIFAEDVALPHLQHACDYRARLALPTALMEVTHAFQMSHESRQELSEQLITSTPVTRVAPIIISWAVSSVNWRG